MAFGKLILEGTFSHWYTILFCKIRSNIVQPNYAIKWPWESHIIFFSSFILLSTNWKNPPFSTISETCFHISLQFLKLTLIFSTNSISLRFWELDFTGKYFSTISETCFHLSTISETHFHLSTISISLQFWTLRFGPECLLKKSCPNFFGASFATGGHTVVWGYTITKIRI